MTFCSSRRLSGKGVHRGPKLTDSARHQAEKQLIPEMQLSACHDHGTPHLFGGHFRLRSEGIARRLPQPGESCVLDEIAAGPGPGGVSCLSPPLPSTES